MLTWPLVLPSGLTTYLTVSWYLFHSHRLAPVVFVVVFCTSPNLLLSLSQVPIWLRNRLELCRPLSGAVSLDKREYLAQEIRRFHISTLVKFAAIVIPSPLPVVLVILDSRIALLLFIPTLGIVHFLQCIFLPTFTEITTDYGLP